MAKKSGTLPGGVKGLRLDVDFLADRAKDLDGRLKDLEREWFNPVLRTTVPGWLRSLEDKSGNHRRELDTLSAWSNGTQKLLTALIEEVADIELRDQQDRKDFRTFWQRLRWLILGSSV